MAGMGKNKKYLSDFTEIFTVVAASYYLHISPTFRNDEKLKTAKLNINSVRSYIHISVMPE